jgi:lysophospholipase L1-like esterase
MARNQFGGTAADVAEDVNGSRVPGAMGTVWDGIGGNALQVTDLTDMNGHAIGQLVADSQGMVPAFMGPDGTEVLWVDFGGGRVAITPIDIGNRLKNHVNNLVPDPHGDRAYADTTFVKLSDAGWLVTPNGKATGKGVQVPRQWGEFWRPKRAAALAGTGKASIAVIGGSTAAGFYASNIVTKSWPGVLRTSLQAANGDGGSGFVSALFSANGIAGSETTAITQWNTSGGLVPQTGTWAVGGYPVGPGWGYLYTSTPSSSMTWTVRGTSVTIYTLGGDGGRSSWTYSIDGATAVSVTDSTTTGLTVLKTTVTGLSAGSHTVKVTHTGTAAQYLSLCGVSAEMNSGVVLNNFAKKNANAAQYLPSGKVGWNGGSSYPADLLIYGVSPQDAIDGVAVDTWASQVRQHLAQVKDGGSNMGATDIVFVLPHIGLSDTQGYRFQDFADRTYALANTFEAAVVDFWNLGRNSWNFFNSLGYWGNSSAPGTAGTDNSLLSDAGNSYMAGVLTALLNS